MHAFHWRAIWIWYFDWPCVDVCFSLWFKVYSNYKLWITCIFIFISTYAYIAIQIHKWFDLSLTIRTKIKKNRKLVITCLSNFQINNSLNYNLERYRCTVILTTLKWLTKTKNKNETHAPRRRDCFPSFFVFQQQRVWYFHESINFSAI